MQSPLSGKGFSKAAMSDAISFCCSQAVNVSFFPNLWLDLYGWQAGRGQSQPLLSQMQSLTGQKPPVLAPEKVSGFFLILVF